MVFRSPPPLLAFVFALAAAPTCSVDARAGFINGDFEKGSLAGWQAEGFASVEFCDSLKTPPCEGGFYAAVQSSGPVGHGITPTEGEAALGLTSGSLAGVEASATNGSILSQSVSVAAGDTLEVSWNFATNQTPGELDFNDFAFLTVGPDQAVVLANQTAAFGPGTTSGFKYETGRHTFTYVLPRTGTFRIGVGVFNAGDDLVSSGLFVDDFRVNSVRVARPPAPPKGAVGN
jgi:hypothetical protein